MERARGRAVSRVEYWFLGDGRRAAHAFAPADFDAARAKLAATAEAIRAELPF